ncbi:MAG: MBL fold metallo-hydrolase [Candidatus Thermoplasmatota archaeon]|nr:MBL fold metallo-hydrolase [Candidatus Thermoplasmatota archaeon]
MTVKIIQIPVGPLEMNATLVMDVESKETIFFDPGDEIESILNVANNEEMKITRLIATHCHIDHIAGSNEAMDKLQMKLEISPLGVPLLGNVGPIAASFVYSISKIEHGNLLNEGEKVTIGNTTFDILHCPGHSPDSLCFYTKGILIGGDLIFKGSVGRTDLPGGNPLELMQSIKEKILPLPEKTIIYPGHGPKTILKEEKENNPFITGKVNII